MTENEVESEALKLVKDAEVHGVLGRLGTDDYILFMDLLVEIASKRAHNARVAKLDALYGKVI